MKRRIEKLEEKVLTLQNEELSRAMSKFRDALDALDRDTLDEVILALYENRYQDLPVEILGSLEPLAMCLRIDPDCLNGRPDYFPKGSTERMLEDIKERIKNSRKEKRNASADYYSR